MQSQARHIYAVRRQMEITLGVGIRAWKGPGEQLQGGWERSISQSGYTQAATLAAVLV